MELQGHVTIAAPRERVWEALQDPAVLQACIPGCEEVQRISGDELHARVMLKLGPVRAHFVGKVKMSDVRPGQGYRLAFEGSGGSAGFARGQSVVQLSDVEEGTRLEYTAEAAVAGKLGQVGGRLLDASARQLANLFFERLRDALDGRDAAPSAASMAPGASGASAPMAVAARAAAGSGAPTMASATSTLGEATRLLWFIAGSAATALGVWLGAHLLR